MRAAAAARPSDRHGAGSRDRRPPSPLRPRSARRRRRLPRQHSSWPAATRLWQFPSARPSSRSVRLAAARCAQASPTPTRPRITARSPASVSGRLPTGGRPATRGGRSPPAATRTSRSSHCSPPRPIRCTTAREAAAIAAAYWPHVCVMSTLLDSLVDYERDASSGNLSFVSHYPDPPLQRGRLIRATSCRLLPSSRCGTGHTHTMIVCGVAGYYAAYGNPRQPRRASRAGAYAALGPTATPIILALRVQHRIGSTRGGRAARWRRARRSPGDAGRRDRGGRDHR